jgi:N-hydroxyarylamine O-acetyltransferase
MASAMLHAYFDRIGWRGATTPSFETLAGLLRAHMLAIPFENLDVLAGRPVRLDPDGLVEKLVCARRGGYCFEHATLLAAVLDELGFEVGRHAARVVLIRPRSEAPRLHMFLTVTLSGGQFVVDPGFGGPAALAPVPLKDGGAEETVGASHWMVRDGDFWILRTRIGAGAGDAWVSTLEEERPIDFAVANHYTATHSDSPFVNRLMLSRFTPEGRVSAMNREATIRRAGETESFPIADRAALRAFIATHLGFDFPEVDSLRTPFIPEWG